MRPTSTGHRASGTAIVAVFLLASTLWVSSAPAVATPAATQIKKTRAEVERARVRLDELAADLEERSEEYLAIEDQLAKTRRDYRIAEDELASAEIEVGAAEKVLNDRVAAIYRNGRLDILSVLFGGTDFRDLVTRLDLFRRVGRSDASMVLRVKDARQQVARNRERLENRRLEEMVLLRSARKKKGEVERALDAQRQYLKGMDRKLSHLIAAERERQERLARARAAAAAAAAVRGAGRAGRPFDPAALGAPHPEVVTSARRFIGKTPYVWGGTTPSGFDCSGLSQYCYLEAGISIPRTSRQQYRFGPFIPPDRLDLLQPGDLVFFGRGGDPGRVHHVGIYSGGGMFIHAPQTGMMVSESSLIARIQAKGDYVGATRPQ